ncbi:ammonium transporter [Thermotoga sp. KOL6]|uniref:ammonium transporter n=1 Tax=Thermotoga sp. KOL6 TaxID=126741 RepID=UPI000C75CE03|nr:ammonium transporter [Thermotoga sp. KOL6]PLV59132.1 ammonium transporter [Thermotoga sp. KOL6]
MRKKVFLLFSILFMISLGFGQSKSVDIEKALDMVWILLSAGLVFFMQAGFAMVESGFTRAKNTVNVIMKNLMDFSVGSIVYFLFGYWIMFGKHPLSFDPSTKEGLWEFAVWMFQMAFAGTAATIVSGAMAERTKFSAYLFYTGFVTGFIYAVVGKWIWGGGWLAQKGFIDFAGSTVVHSVGGWAAMIGAALLGPRFGKYDSRGNPRPIPGHNIPLAALGTFILWFGWFGFNGGSTLAGTNAAIGMIILNTNLAAAAGAITAMMTVWLRFGKPDASMTMNGALAGLVAVTAPCAVISPVSSIIVGAIGGILVVFAVEFFDKVLKIDDPVGAISVHGINGAWGTIAVGLFVQSKYAQASGIGDINGFFFGGGIHLLVVQLMGVASVFVWTVVTSFLVFWMIKKTIGLRVDRDTELKGLDIDEHGMEGYADFEIFTTR